MTLLRAFMDQENPLAYKMLFTFVFQLITDITGGTTYFHYLHGDGLKAIVIDMDYSQLKGMF